VCLLRELRRHGVRHQRRGVLLWSLRLGEGELRVSGGRLWSHLRSELSGLEVALASERSRLVVEIGLSVAVEAASAEAVSIAIAGPIASVLGVCAKSFALSVVIPSTVIPVPITAKITPARIPIPTVVSEVTTSAAP